MSEQQAAPSLDGDALMVRLGQRIANEVLAREVAEQRLEQALAAIDTLSAALNTNQAPTTPVPAQP